MLDHNLDELLLPKQSDLLDKVVRKTNYLMAQDMLLSLYRDYATQGERKTLSLIDSIFKM